MPIKVFAHTSKPEKKASHSTPGPCPIPPSAARRFPHDRILYLQRWVGNRSSRKLLRSNGAPDSAGSRCAGRFPAPKPGRAHGRILLSDVSANLSIRRSALKKYKRSRRQLNRRLAAIKRIKNPARRQTQQIKFLQTIYRSIIGNNPFASIQVKKLRPWAETEWIDTNRKSLGIKVVFSKDIFKQSLTSIIATAIHEATHAAQLKKGMDYYPRPGRLVGKRQLAYLETVRHFAEADAYLESYSRFGAALKPGRIKMIGRLISKHLEAADKNLTPMALAFYNRQAYRRAVTDLFKRPKLKHAKQIIKLWKKNKRWLKLKNDLLPWGKLP